MRGNRQSRSEPELREVAVVGTSEQTYNYRKVRSLIDAHLLYDGQVSQRHYEWFGAGSVVEVDERDIPELLAKRIGNNASCCGGQVKQGNTVFELYDE